MKLFLCSFLLSAVLATSQAAIIHIVPDEPIFLPPTNFTGPISWDVDSDGTVDFLYRDNGSTFGIIAEEFNRFTSDGQVGDPVPFGSVVGPVLPTKVWASGTQGLFACASGDNGVFCVGDFQEHGYLGIEFRIGSETHYGWVFLDINAPFVEAWMMEWAYTNPNREYPSWRETSRNRMWLC